MSRESNDAFDAFAAREGYKPGTWNYIRAQKAWQAAIAHAQSDPCTAPDCDCEPGIECQGRAAARGVEPTPAAQQVRDVSVGVMTESGGKKTYFVCINRADGERITPHSFTEEWKAEYEVREYADFFGVRGLDAKGDDLPDSDALLERSSSTAASGVPASQEPKQEQGETCIHNSDVGGLRGFRCAKCNTTYVVTAGVKEDSNG